MKKRKKKRFGKVLLFIIIIILSYIFVFKTDFFIIQDIVVNGNEKLSYDSIVKASSIYIGENIFRIDIKAGENNLKKLSYVKNCNIKRKFPNKIIIEVEERKEIVAIEYLKNLYYIDNEGYILFTESIENKEEINLPIITGINNVELNENNNFYEEISIENMDKLIYYSENLDLIYKMKEIDISNIENINIRLKDDILVDFGPLNNVKYKLSFLIEILKDIEKKSINVKNIQFNKGENPIIVMDNR